MKKQNIITQSLELKKLKERILNEKILITKDFSQNFNSINIEKRDLSKHYLQIPKMNNNKSNSFLSSKKSTKLNDIISSSSNFSKKKKLNCNKKKPFIKFLLNGKDVLSQTKKKKLGIVFYYILLLIFKDPSYLRKNKDLRKKSKMKLNNIHCKQTIFKNESLVLSKWNKEKSPFSQNLSLCLTKPTSFDI